MAAPTLTSSAISTWSDNVNTDEVTASLSWNSGDRILVVAMTEDQGFTLATPTATGLTFTALGTAVTVANSCWLHVWQATAGSSGSGTITASRATSTGVAMRGLAAFAWGSCTGFVRTNKGGGSGSVNSTQTVSVTRTQANSAIVTITGDWSAGSVASIAWTPAGATQVVAQTNTGGAAAVGRWGDQGATGTTSYGTTGMAGNAFTISAVEVLGTVSSSTTATAENATGAGTANNATAAITPAAQNAAGTGTAENATAVVTAAGQNAAGVGTAENAVAAVVAMAEAATAAAAANDATVSTGGGGGSSESLFTSQTPVITDASDGTPGITTATTVRFAADGQVSAAKFYATVTVGGTYTVGFWRVDSSDPGGGTLLASKTMSSPPTGGTWNTVNFDTPVTVLADTAYRVGVFSSAGRYVATTGFFTGADLVNGNITADQPGDTIGSVTINNGVFRIDSVFEYPNTSGSGACYFTDVVYAVGAANTTAPAECATAAATAYDATVSTAAATTAPAENAAGTGTANDATVAVVALAEVATAAGTANNATVSVPGGVQNLFTSQTPALTDQSDGTPGIVTATTWRTGVDGQVSGVRFYATTTVSGTYTVGLWSVDTSDPGGGTLLASKTMSSPPTGGTWNTVNFDSPVSVTADLPYRAGVFSSAGRYVATANFFTTDLVNGNLTADVSGDTVSGRTINNGTFRQDGTFDYPNGGGNDSAYFVDVAFSVPAAVVALAEVATATAEVPFDTGTQISLTLVADAPIDAAGTAYDASTAVVAMAEVATAAGTAYEATVATVTETIVSAQVATAAGVAYDAVAALVVPATEVATAVGVAYTPGVAAIPEVVVAAQVATAAGTVPAAHAVIVPPVDAAAEAVAAAFDAVIAAAAVAEVAEAAAAAGDAGISVVVVVPEPASAVASVFAPTATAGPVWIAPAECATAVAEAYGAAAGVVAMAGLAQAGAVAFDAVAGPTPVEVIVAWLSTVRDTTPAATVRRSV